MSLSVAKGNFAYINDLAVPYPKIGTGNQTVSTFVDAGRTASGVVKGEVVGRNIAKVELVWDMLTPEQWSTMLKEFKRSFYFRFRYIDMETNDWVTRRFYVSDRSANPFMINPETNRPRYWQNCKLNVIDCGD